ncbi:MAG: L,D-transpeptidase [Leptolyngbyaceae cyanobacterium CSU_1_3]|nr:L,D-transpeptidase [Leptolyngbyaceae cyanobacterium CSU_1_3]
MFLCVGTGLLLVGVQWPASNVSKLFASGLQWTQPKPKPNPSPSQPSPIPDSKIVVDLSDRRVFLYKQNRRVASYLVAIGQEGWETPTGSFKVLQMYRNPVWQHPITGQKILPGKKNPLGQWWIGFTNQEDLLIGFHGTAEEDLLGQAVSHGCVRMKNLDIGKIYREVAIGTPVTVRP